MNVLRWIFFIPVAVLCSALGSGLLNLIIHWITPYWKIVSTIGSVIGYHFAGIAMPFLWMFIGMKIAPKKNHLSKWLLLAPLLIVTFGALLGVIFGDPSPRYIPQNSINPKIGHIIMNGTSLVICFILIGLKPEMYEKD